jgi:putative phosphoribosyl transferase
MTPFRNREHAAELLSEQLQSWKDGKGAVICTLPRGGVVLGAVLSEKLRLPLELIFVKKIGHPVNPDVAIGACSETDTWLENGHWWKDFGIQQAIVNAKFRIEQQKKSYQVSQQDLSGKTILLVDDGLATGITMEHAIRELKKRNVGKIILAVPVAPLDICEKMQEEVDELICLHQPIYFSGVGQFYEEFEQVEDDEVIRLLKQKSPA